MSISQPQLDVEQEAGGCVEDVKSSWLLVSRHSAVWRDTRHTLQVVLFSRDSHDETLTENSLSVLQGMLLCNLAVLSAT